MRITIKTMFNLKNVSKMKNVKVMMMMTLMMCLMTMVSFGQIQIEKSSKLELINKVKSFGVERLSLSRSIIDSDTTYYIGYVNNAYKSILDRRSTYITATTQEMLELEEVMLDIIDGNIEEDVSVIFERDKKFLLSKTGRNSLFIFNTKNNYFIISKKEIIKLFEVFH